MKFLLNLTLLFIASYCYSVNTKDNSVSSSGLNCFGVNFKENHIELKTNVLKTDGNLEIEIVDIKGFTVINGNANANFTMCVINSQNDTLLTFKKVFLLDPNKKFNLLTNLKISVIPYLVVYEKYTILLKVDDNASDKYLSCSFPFNIKHNSFLKTSSEVLNFSHIYLWNETKKEIIHDNILFKEEKYKLLIYGVENFKELKEKIYPKIFCYFSSKSAFNKSDINNVIVDKTESGVSKNIISENPIIISLDITPLEEYPSEAIIMIKILDSKSDSKIKVYGEFIIK